MSNGCADIEELHRIACGRGETTYTDPESGFTVFTELAHQKRGACCGSGCRHCPFDHANVRPRQATSDEEAEASDTEEEFHSDAGSKDPPEGGGGDDDDDDDKEEEEEEVEGAGCFSACSASGWCLLRLWCLWCLWCLCWCLLCMGCL